MPSIPEPSHNYAEDSKSESKADIPKSIIFWDWDDTLLCSSFLSSEGYRLDSDMKRADDDLMRQLKDLEVSIIKVLEVSLTRGEVQIITNAETGWVQLSAQKFVPGVVPLLDKIKIVSARSTYEGMFPGAPLKWKYCAFQNELCDLLQKADVEKHIISFGDSHVEREAIRAVTKDCLNTKTKNIKFAERPTIEQLQRQVELATDCFDYIHTHDGDLDLCMSLSMVPTNQQGENEVPADLPEGAHDDGNGGHVPANDLPAPTPIQDSKSSSDSKKQCGMDAKSSDDAHAAKREVSVVS